jgi:hypothetical protein
MNELQISLKLLYVDLINFQLIFCQYPMILSYQACSVKMAANIKCTCISFGTGVTTTSI